MIKAPIRSIPQLPWIGSEELVFWRVASLSRFWEKGSGAEDPAVLWEAARRFVIGVRQCIGFVMAHRGGRLQAVGWVAEARQPLCGPLEACFPGIRLEPVAGGLRSIVSAFSPFPGALMLSGNPSLPPSNVGAVQPNPCLPGLEYLVAGLSREEWLYVVIASPLNEGERFQELQIAFSAERDARLKYLRPGTVLEHINPIGKAIVAQAEARLSKLKEGLLTGLWHSCCLLFLRKPDAFSQAASILTASFGGEHSLPDPLKVEFCLSSARVHDTEKVVTTTLNSGELTRFMLVPSRESPGYPVRTQTLFDSHLPVWKEKRRIHLGTLTSS